MKNPRVILLVIALAMSLALPFLVPSGALLTAERDRLLEEMWEAEDDAGALPGGLLALLLPRAHAATAEEQYALPADFSPGAPLDPAGFREDGYEDPSVSVRLETVEEEGVVWRIAFVSVAHPTQLRTATAGSPTSSRVALISSMAKKQNAVLALNANYMANDPVKTSYEYRMGVKVRAKPNRSKDLLVIDQNADFRLFVKSQKAEIDAFLENGGEIVNAFTFGPALVKDGELLDLNEDYGYNPRGREPRMAIGQIAPLTYVVVHAEGRTSESQGVTHEELAARMFDLGCMQAFNLDGGNSATLVFNGVYYQHKSVDNERAQSDMIYFASGVK
ncbi:MAG TPA: phosphodiester glycosidase family protein [Candidatus Limnocylindria bacterium]|nr:phosphodiester glycosidase family protein [Candidatus Limnocylindria bacterium]